MNELRDVLGEKAVDGLVHRLNRPGKDRLAAMWETVVLHALSNVGKLESEVELASGRRPDIKLEASGLLITADVTAVSDDGLDNDNPYLELSHQVEKAKRRLGLPIGGLDLQVRARHKKTSRGTQTVLLLPPKKQLDTFVRDCIVPQLRNQIEAGERVLRVSIDDEDVGIDVTVDPDRSPYISMGFAAYDVPKIKDRNPLYNALKAKATQLRGAEGIVGIVVGDGDCSALAGRPPGRDRVTADVIVGEFFRQFTRVDFVLLLGVTESRRSWRPSGTVRQNAAGLHVRDGSNLRSRLCALFDEMLTHFPTPTRSPVNGALRAREEGYDLGHHGSYTMSQSSVRLSLREFTEILAGLRTLADNGAKNVEAARKLSGTSNRAQAMIERNLSEGRLPSSIEVFKTGENDSDDYVEIRFGEVDPAIAPFR
ncbi:hypothetical protein [Aureimonas phyllosphaerae]|uniref:hypothetical protein n=1 Tax=Aureimonas phyllosphaerae TaxID=1166078 RepID=UPI001FCCF026|nr:hypothetical protein [Aureimonas phyllosphaerae]